MLAHKIFLLKLPLIFDPWITGSLGPISWITGRSSLKEGFALLARAVGTPVSDCREGIVNGRPFVKAKLIVSLHEPLKDMVTLDHPSLGDLTDYVVYERVSKACTCCGTLGHEIQGYATHIRLQRIANDLAHKDKPEVQGITKPRLGAWITAPHMIP